METTFFTLHDLSSAVRVRFASQAVEDVLGYEPDEVINTSMWDYLHPDEIPLAEEVLERNVRHDKAATLNYFHLRHKRGHWVTCEAMSTVVYNVLVASISIYLSGPRSEKRAADAPVVRMLFSSGKHPQNHFLYPPQMPYSAAAREPRAVLVLNRFSRSSPIIYATSSVSAVLGVAADQLLWRSFYHCIDESCLHQAVQCIEGAKANDSVAYLRFWFRYPPADEHADSDDAPMSPRSDYFSGSEDEEEDDGTDDSDMSTLSDYSDPISSPRPDAPGAKVEVEVVVSCSSDGIVVVLRQATAPIPGFVHHSGHPVYVNRECPSCVHATMTMQEQAGKSLPSPRPGSGVGGPDPEALISSIRGAALLNMKGQRCMS